MSDQENACPVTAMLEDTNGEWIKVVGTDDDGKVVDIHIVCKGVTAQDFLPVVEAFEETFE